MHEYWWWEKCDCHTKDQEDLHVFSHMQLCSSSQMLQRFCMLSCHVWCVQIRSVILKISQHDSLTGHITIKESICSFFEWDSRRPDAQKLAMINRVVCTSCCLIMLVLHLMSCWGSVPLSKYYVLANLKDQKETKKCVTMTDNWALPWDEIDTQSYAGVNSLALSYYSCCRSTTLLRKVQSAHGLEESMCFADILLERKDALHASFARQYVFCSMFSLK